MKKKGFFFAKFTGIIEQLISLFFILIFISSLAYGIFYLEVITIPQDITNLLNHYATIISAASVDLYSFFGNIITMLQLGFPLNSIIYYFIIAGFSLIFIILFSIFGSNKLRAFKNIKFNYRNTSTDYLFHAIIELIILGIIIYVFTTISTNSLEALLAIPTNYLGYIIPATILVVVIFSNFIVSIHAKFSTQNLDKYEDDLSLIDVEFSKFNLQDGAPQATKLLDDKISILTSNKPSKIKAIAFPKKQYAVPLEIETVKTPSLSEEIEKYNDLRSRGLITQKEFEVLKAAAIKMFR